VETTILNKINCRECGELISNKQWRDIMGKDGGGGPYGGEMHVDGYKEYKLNNKIIGPGLIEPEKIDIIELAESLTKQPIKDITLVACSKCNEVSFTMIDGVCNTCLSEENENDEIDWPKHYNTGKIQPIDVIEDWDLDFRLANTVKYIQRHKYKGNAKKDLEKAIWYIQRYINKELTKEENNG
jgi:hypothetical protein